MKYHRPRRGGKLTGLRPNPRLVRVVVRKPDDRRREAFLVSVELADFHLGADFRVGDINPRQGDRISLSLLPWREKVAWSVRTATDEGGFN